MSHTERAYLPAAGHDWALPLYDPFVKLIGGESARAALIHQANLQPGHRVLDIGCGTGTLAVRIKQVHPSVSVVGLDPDAKALGRAMRKAQRAGTSVQFDRGYSDEFRIRPPHSTWCSLRSCFTTCRWTRERKR